MTWMCPHEYKGNCTRRDAPCDAGQPGCVLEGRIAPAPIMSPETSPALLKNAVSASDLRNRTIEAMRMVFGRDARRINHAINVLCFAENILTQEPGDRTVVVAAAILHDIGIHEAERKYRSAAGNYQEIEGPPIARRIMESLGYEEPVIDHVCRIIANHHSARDIDTPEFRILWDADWLVNLPEEFPGASQARLEKMINRVFRTSTGREIAKEQFLTSGKKI